MADTLGNEVPLRIKWVKGEPVPLVPVECELHTKSPDSFPQWDVWAKRMAKTHVQRQCRGCGLWSVWEVKAAAGETA
jgi:hypothetical protein